MAAAQLLERCLDLLLLDVVIFFILRATWQSLPREGALEQVEQNVADGFEIITTRLLNTLVCVDGGVASGSSQVFAVLVRNVLALRVLEALGQSEINDVDIVFGDLSAANKEVVRLDVSVNYALFVHFLNASQLAQPEQRVILV